MWCTSGQKKKKKQSNFVNVDEIKIFDLEQIVCWLLVHSTIKRIETIFEKKIKTDFISKQYKNQKKIDFNILKSKIECT